ncbi:hypothetical protein H5410_008444 [Solanum commersonii]|uniref:Uncharacterized protein n=1 Tax=Solanum commersonii TaxID=4109 RepID=A0A9J6AGL1_SOLCO|nr:hypothetical protein H5410_008444 [Solanum commersonii]
MFGSWTSHDTLPLYTNLETSGHLDDLGFKSGTHMKDKSIWKIGMHDALTFLIALIKNAISGAASRNTDPSVSSCICFKDKTNLLASFFIFFLKEANLTMLDSVFESCFLLLIDDATSLTCSLHCDTNSLIVPQTSRILMDCSNKSSNHFPCWEGFKEADQGTQVLVFLYSGRFLLYQEGLGEAGGVY